MAAHTGPPKDEIKLMIPSPIADEQTPQPIPGLVHSEMTGAECAAARFSLKGKTAIGQYDAFRLEYQAKSTKSLEVRKVWVSIRAWS